MLILSRRPSETIHFPQLGVSVSIVAVKGNRVRVGIDAPPEIKVLRRELDAEQPSCESAGIRTAPQTEGEFKMSHSFRNRLNQATLGLHLAQKQLAADLVDSAEKTLARALIRLAELESDAAASALPASARSHVRPNPALNAPDGSQATDEDSSTIDVLLVEDEQNERALLRGLLEMEGYRVQTAANGLEALECLQRMTPRFVLLDMMMPECDGRETLRRIRQSPAWRDLPVIAVSGSAPSSLGISAGGGDGIDEWFPKPLNAPRLVAHLRSRVDGVLV